VVRTDDVTGSDQLVTSSVLHVRCGSEVRQHAIHVTRQGRWRLADTEVSFSTLANLIAYYCDPHYQSVCHLQNICDFTLWHQQLPYGYSCRASCARPD